MVQSLIQWLIYPLSIMTRFWPEFSFLCDPFLCHLARTFLRSIWLVTVTVDERGFPAGLAQSDSADSFLISDVL